MLGTLVQGLVIAVLESMQPDSKNHGYRCQDQWGECIFCVREFTTTVIRNYFE